MIGQKDRKSLVIENTCEMLNNVELPSSVLTICYREISFSKRAVFFLQPKGPLAYVLEGRRISTHWTVGRWDEICKRVKRLVELLGYSKHAVKVSRYWRLNGILSLHPKHKPLPLWVFISNHQRGHTYAEPGPHRPVTRGQYDYQLPAAAESLCPTENLKSRMPTTSGSQRGVSAPVPEEITKFFRWGNWGPGKRSGTAQVLEPKSPDPSPVFLYH